MPAAGRVVQGDGETVYVDHRVSLLWCFPKTMHLMRAAVCSKL